MYQHCSLAYMLMADVLIVHSLSPELSGERENTSAVPGQSTLQNYSTLFRLTSRTLLFLDIEGVHKAITGLPQCKKITPKFFMYLSASYVEALKYIKNYDVQSCTF